MGDGAAARGEGPVVAGEGEGAELREALDKCTGSLREQVSEATWQLWLSGLEPVSFAGGEFVLGVPNAVVRERVESRYLPLIEDTLANEVGSRRHRPPPDPGAPAGRRSRPAGGPASPADRGAAAPP